MILIDTSAWIEFFRRRGDPRTKARVHDCLGIGEGAYTCPIRFELILGARPEEADDVLTGLGLAKRIVLSSAHWDAAAALAAQTRVSGIQIPVIDLLIAVVAVRGKHPLLTQDSHFTLLRKKFLPKLRLA